MALSTPCISFGIQSQYCDPSSSPSDSADSYPVVLDHFVDLLFPLCDMALQVNHLLVQEQVPVASAAEVAPCLWARLIEWVIFKLLSHNVDCLFPVGF